MLSLLENISLDIINAAVVKVIFSTKSLLQSERKNKIEMAQSMDLTDFKSLLVCNIGFIPQRDKMQRVKLDDVSLESVLISD